MAIAHARSVDALRRRGRYRQREQDDSEAPEYASEDRYLAASVEQHQSREELAMLLNQLPARQRQVIEHVHLHEMTLSETATHNNLTVAAVKSLLHRALSNLRRLGAHHGRS
jgi:RNA polymerase sigma-70 factor (ECF subfamily)